MKPGDFKEITMNRILHLAQSVGAAECMNISTAQKIGNGGGTLGHYIACPSVFFSIPFYPK
jgi:hypothetical protein